jgi:SAM-dependent methyltransferase
MTQTADSRQQTAASFLRRVLPGPIKKFLSKLKHVLLKPQGYLSLFSDLKKIKRQKEESNNDDFIFGSLSPCFQDKSASSGMATGHYFHQDLLVARRIFERRPEIHVDVGSRVDGFVAHVASFREIRVIDIRPPEYEENAVKNIRFIQQDFMAELPETMLEMCDSLSSLHVMEHFGLGRYGDKVDYNGHFTGMENLHKILKKGGILYFSVPIGEPQRIHFHSHRVFSVKYLLKWFNERFDVKMLSYIDDYGDLHENVILTEAGIDNSFGCKSGCGIFELEKK